MLNGPITDLLVSIAPAIANANKQELPRLLDTARLELHNLLNSEEVLSEFRRYLTDASAGKSVPIEDGKQGEIVLRQQGPVFISIASYDTPAKFLHSHPIRGVFQVLAGASFQIDRFLLPDNWSPEQPSQEAQLNYCKTEQVAVGDSITIDGSNEVVWFRYQSEVVVAKYIVALHATQNWTFDPQTLYPLDAESAEGRFDAIAHAADLLRAIGSKTSLESLEHAAQNHHVHFVRWACLRAVVVLNRNHGIELLERLLKQPKDPLHSSASKALARIQERN
jgi:hypothetical protein